jgi:Uma2 family endonuclease
MTKALKKDAKYADLYDVPEHFVAEILGGELYASPRPAYPHAFAASALGAKIGGPFQFGINGPGGWLVLDEPELRLGDDVLVPDLAAWRRERLPAVSTGEYPALAPDWVCEVLSPSTAKIDRVKKLAIYARENVRSAWLVDPLQQTLEILGLEAARWSLLATHEAGARVRAEPFAAVELDLGTLWAV